jgi:hypothetical protein
VAERNSLLYNKKYKIKYCILRKGGYEGYTGICPLKEYLLNTKISNL